MAYNPNEIVKLKHLNEFAAQLGDKLDGKTGTTSRTISSVISITGSTVTLDDGVYKIQAPQNVITGNPKSVNIYIDSAQFNPLPTFMPRLADMQITGGFKFYSWRIELRSVPRLICYFTQANTPEVGETVKGTIIVPADENFAELDVSFEVTVV